MSRNYPTSSQYFPHLMEHDVIYVDKTPFIYSLMRKKSNPAYFLSRPRRFGKSLLVSTLEQVFLGKKELFKNLYLYDKIEWKEYPVIRLSLDKIGFTEIGLTAALENALQLIAKDYNVLLNAKGAGLSFQDLILKLHEKYQQKVVILIDEYDKPIIHGIEKEDVTVAETHRDILKSFYGILKDNEAHLQFTFLTGVSKFAKVSIFSDLNHLDDLTLDTQYAAICGFTETEIRHYCADGLQDLAIKEKTDIDGVMDKIRFWYDGFSWNAQDFVYNPFSTMFLMQKQVFDIYWFDSGTPTFLVKLIHKHYNYNFKKLKVSKSIYNWYDLKKLNYVSIMLQTGYLTFKRHIEDDIYEIGFPNKEVDDAFSKMLLGDYLESETSIAGNTVHDIQTAFKQNDTQLVIALLTNMFKILPSQFFWEDGEKRDKQGNVTIIKKQVNENFYHAIIYLIFNILSIRMKVEIPSSFGRIDAIVETDTHVYLFEFKKGRNADDAIQQIIENQYANLYSLSNKQIVLMGVCFTAAKRGISSSKILNLEEALDYRADLKLKI